MQDSAKKPLPYFVVITYSFDPEVVAIIFDTYEKACEFIRNDFASERKIDEIENKWEIDENVTKCEEGYAVLGTIYPSGSKTETTTWRIARIAEL